MNKLSQGIAKNIISVLIMTLIGSAVLFFVCSPIFAIVKKSFVQTVVKGQPRDVLREEGLTSEDDQEDNRKSVQTRYGVLSCKAIGLKTMLYFGDTEENLLYGACVYSGAGIPGGEGTTLISAHNTMYFAPLEKIKVNDRIRIKLIDKIAVYKVDQIQITKDYDQYTISSTGEQKLVLYTCYPFNTPGYKTDQRFFVTCSFIKNKKLKAGDKST
ncbi:MAG: class D sortase [Lachnoclostridium sp.]|jgi:sortase A|nr:class D sortase [Lachnoclostridium sp.]